MNLCLFLVDIYLEFFCDPVSSQAKWKLVSDAQLFQSYAAVGMT